MELSKNNVKNEESDVEIVYFSRTGNIKRFVHKLSQSAIKANGEMEVNKPFIAIIYTTGIGEVPAEINEFFKLEINQQNCLGLVCSGNKNWGINYCKAAHIISKQINVAVLQEFELSGNIHDVNKFEVILEEIKNENRA